MKEPGTLKRVLIMAGGTGGHVFPGLAIATCLREEGIAIDWLGTSKGIEARLVPEANFPLHLVEVGGLRGKGIKPLISAPFKLIAAVLKTRRIIRKLNPDVVIGMGGFVSGPGGIAAWLCGRPLVIHEQNAKAGFTNKILALVASRILQGFPGAFNSSKAIYIGNPVRQDIKHLPSPDERFKNKGPLPLHLLVLGGSLGAKALNEKVPRALALLNESERPQVRHQTGEKHFEETQNLYKTMKIDGDLKPFIKDMAHAYAWADVVLCRAGALTVAELCAAGVGAIFVPFPHAVDDHQTANANFMVKQQAALCVPQTELTESRLADIVREFIHSPERRLQMAQAAWQLRNKDVTEKIIEICKEVCR